MPAHPQAASRERHRQRAEYNWLKYADPSIVQVVRAAATGRPMRPAANVR